MNIEIRTDGVLHIDGYVNAVERDSREILTKEGRCVERVLPGVFGKALASAEEVRMLLNHRSDRQLASTKDTLVLEEDAIGLRATADITDEEVIEKARLGKLKGWSFGFRANDTAMESRANSVPRRILKDISLFEVSVIDDEHNPCYKSTSLNCEFRAEDDIELRTDEKILDEFREQWYNEYYLPRYYRFLEVRFNPYHDVYNGRFTDSSGGGLGAYTYVGKGEKGKGKTVFDSDIWGEDRDLLYEEWKKEKSFDNITSYGKIKEDPSNGDVSRMIRLAESKGVEFNAVNNLDKPLTEREIIEKISGGDMTGGACVSIAYAYIGNKAGYDVTDFRGGNSRDLFSNQFKVWQSQAFKNAEIGVAGKKTIADKIKAKPDGEYLLSAGEHAAIIKKSGDSIKYLELQSPNPKENIFVDFETRGPKRFEIKSTDMYCICDTASIANSKGFKEMLGYINTQPNNQLKGDFGYEK